MAELVDTIKSALNNLVTLEIITAVGQIKHQPPKGEPPDSSQRLPDIDWDQDPKVMLTKLDLIQGDIKTVMDAAFVTGDYQALRDFHRDREREGFELVHKNLEALKELYNLAREWM